MTGVDGHIWWDAALVIARADQVESWIPAFADGEWWFLVIMSFQGKCCVRGGEGPVSERGTPLRQHFVLPPPLRGEDEVRLPCAPASDHRSGRSIWMWRSVHLAGVSQPGVGFLGGGHWRMRSFRRSGGAAFLKMFWIGCVGAAAVRSGCGVPALDRNGGGVRALSAGQKTARLLGRAVQSFHPCARRECRVPARRDWVAAAGRETALVQAIVSAEPVAVIPLPRASGHIAGEMASQPARHDRIRQRTGSSYCARRRP